MFNQLQLVFFRFNQFLLIIKKKKCGMIMVINCDISYLRSALADINQFQEAIQCFNEAICVNPKYGFALIGKGNLFLLQNIIRQCISIKLEQYQDAINCFTEVISINLKSDTSWTGKGCALGNLFQYNEAIQCFNEAISNNPKYADAWNQKGIALNNLNQYQEAIECPNEAIAINPKNVHAWNNKDNLL
ncbi:unnamed protein product [Paramecium octaurelia]|uniref:Tetratricopeptide repeat protein n=1 Tax=Paramecium octaurelia TaxID=43137 RepID=A0A8S1YP75_PAROT|nr:unnamed protein product [Paramecium octaurelia]